MLNCRMICVMCLFLHFFLASSSTFVKSVRKNADNKSVRKFSGNFWDQKCSCQQRPKKTLETWVDELDKMSVGPYPFSWKCFLWHSWRAWQNDYGPILVFVCFFWVCFFPWITLHRAQGAPIHVCVWRYVCLYKCTYLCMHVRIYVCKNVFISICVRIHVFKNVFTSICVHACLYVCTDIYIYIFVCVFVYVCVHLNPKHIPELYFLHKRFSI